MLPLFRAAFIISLVLPVVAVAGCASRNTASIPSAPVGILQSEIVPDEAPEPLTPGVKPLTVEQEETMTQ